MREADTKVSEPVKPENRQTGTSAAPLMNCSVGVFAHNEAANIAALLQSLSAQSLANAAITEIIVVSSGLFLRSFELKKPCPSFRIIQISAGFFDLKGRALAKTWSPIS